MNKTVYIIWGLCMGIVLFSGCKRQEKNIDDTVSISNNINDETSNLEEKELIIDNVEGENNNLNKKRVLPIATTNYASKEMISRSNLGTGNLLNLKNVMKRAEKKEEITIGFIGGSITEGSSATQSQNSYAYKTYEWFSEAFKETKVNYVNAGIGATNSYLGVHRVETDLLNYNPDVIVIEYSVNDSNTNFYKETYEDLIRKIISYNNKIAIILLFTTMEDGTSAQSNHVNVGFYYDIPRISYREAILESIANGEFTWNDISPDNIHPNDRGHGIITELMYSFFNQVLSSLDNENTQIEIVDNSLPTSLFLGRYMDAYIADAKLITPTKLGSFYESSVHDRYKNGWSTKTGDESIIFWVECKNIGIMFYAMTNGQYGQYEVYIDGEYKETLDGDFKDGWGDYAETTEVYRGKEKQKHIIEIRRAKDSSGEQFHILGLLIS